MIKGYIFDLDGVIVSTDRYHFLAWKKVADEEGIYFDQEINNRLRGVSRMESLDIVLERAQRDYRDEEKVLIAARKNECYKRYLVDMSPKDVTAEVTQTLKALRNRGAKLAIGSSSKNALYILQRVGLNDFFDAVSDGNNITNSKPDPEVFLRAAEMLELNAKDCLVIEDADAGVDAGIAGGFQVAAMGAARRHPSATYALDRFSDIIKIRH